MDPTIYLITNHEDLYFRPIPYSSKPNVKLPMRQAKSPFDKDAIPRRPNINPNMKTRFSSRDSLFLANLDSIFSIIPFKINIPNGNEEESKSFRYAEFGRENLGISEYIQWRGGIQSRGYIFETEELGSSKQEIRLAENEVMISRPRKTVDLIYCGLYFEDLIYAALKWAVHPLYPLAKKETVFITAILFDKEPNLDYHILLTIAQIFEEFYVINPLSTRYDETYKPFFVVARGLKLDDEKIIKGLREFKYLGYKAFPERFLTYVEDRLIAYPHDIFRLEQQLQNAQYWKLGALWQIPIEKVETINWLKKCRMFARNEKYEMPEESQGVLTELQKLEKTSRIVQRIGQMEINNLANETVAKIIKRKNIIDKLEKTLEQSETKSNFANFFSGDANTASKIVFQVIFSSRLVDENPIDPVMPSRLANLELEGALRNNGANSNNVALVRTIFSREIRNFAYLPESESIFYAPIEQKGKKGDKLVLDGAFTFKLPDKVREKLQNMFLDNPSDFNPLVYDLLSRYTLFPFQFFPLEFVDLVESELKISVQLFTSPFTAVLPRYTGYFDDLDTRFSADPNIFNTLNAPVNLKYFVLVEPLPSNYYLAVIIDLAFKSLEGKDDAIWIISCPKKASRSSNNNPLHLKLSNSPFKQQIIDLESNNYAWRDIYDTSILGDEDVTIFFLANFQLKGSEEFGLALTTSMLKGVQVEKHDQEKLLNRIIKQFNLNQLEESVLTNYINYMAKESRIAFLEKILENDREYLEQFIDEDLENFGETMFGKKVTEEIEQTGKIQLTKDDLNSTVTIELYKRFLDKLRGLSAKQRSDWYDKIGVDPKKLKGSQKEKRVAFYTGFKNWLVATKPAEFDELLEFIAD